MYDGSASGPTHYNWNRFYDPQTGRYIQSDPIGLNGGINTYLYANAAPTMYTDPLGLNPATAAGAGIGTLILPGPGTVVGGVVGTVIGAGIGWYVTGPMFADKADDPVVYPDNPDAAPDKFERIPKSPGRFCPEDGSVWERDTSSHGGDQWKRWPDKRSWEKGKKPNSVWPDGRVRK